MISPVSSSTVPAPATAQVRNSAAQPAAQPAQDKVQLSPKALSSGDIDHDGDSH
jgi:hypothetical protein